MKVRQKKNGKGSLRNIQLLINRNVELINSEIRKLCREFENDEIIWVSPMKEDEFAEYSDDDFLRQIDLNPDEIKLSVFWPKRGPQWDALAKTAKGKIILVEAKANIREFVGSPTKAKEESVLLIRKSLNETKSFLDIANGVDWSGRYYQYANRLSHLYFLREQCGKQVYLVNVYFIGDSSVKGPDVEEKWHVAEKARNTYLQITDHKLTKYVLNIFIDIDKLKGM